MTNQEQQTNVDKWAKQIGVSNDLVLKLLRDKGIEVRSHLSPMPSKHFDAIREQALAEKTKNDARKSNLKKPATLGAKGVTRADDLSQSGETVSVRQVKGAKVVLKRSSEPAEEHHAPQKRVDPTPLRAPAAVLKPQPAPVAQAPQAVQSEPAKAPSFNTPPDQIQSAKVESHRPVADVTPKPVASAPTPVHASAPAVATHVQATVAPSAPEHKEPSPVQAQPAVVANEPSATANVEATGEKEIDSGDANSKSTPFKATIEKPNAEILARIERSRQQAAQQRNRGPGGGGGRPTGPGYTGSFGRAPAGQQGGGAPGGYQGGNRGPGGPGAGPSGPSNRGPGGPGRGPGERFGNTMGDAFSSASQRVGTAGPSGPAPQNNSGAPGNKGPVRTGGGPNKSSAKGKGGGKGSKPEKQKEQAEMVRQNISRVMASLSKTPVKKSYRKEASDDSQDQNRQILKTSDFITVGELAGLMEQMPAKVIAKCMEMGMMVTINHRLDFDTIQVLADEFGFDAQLMEEYEEETLGVEQELEENLTPRPPVVTVMGHVDHGKTSLLDYVRKANVVAGESGGITQHVGAYEVVSPHGHVTFLDTPGHEAFSAMRARGSQVTDVIVLAVAADSMVMPQTVECIELAKGAKVPIVVAITKMDLPTANPDKIRAQLSERGVEVEQWGGQVSCVEVSARSGAGMDRLLEVLALETEVLDLKANKNARARGTVVESRLDPGKGSMATVLIQNGTLHVGDIFVCGNYSGRVRAMYDERGNPKKEAGPSSPAQVLGFDGTPQAGDDLLVFEDEKAAREIASNRRMAARERELRFRKHMSLEQVYDRVKSGEFSELNLIVKADVDGSSEAIAASLDKLSNKEVKINIIRKAVGAINDSDILLASSADAVIIAYHLMPNLNIREMAQREGVEIRTYRIIYECIEDIQGVVEGMLKPTTREELFGEAEIREVFKIPKIGLIAGCMVRDGEVDRESQVRIYRDGVELGLTKVQSLKRHKDDASSVKKGMECGIGLKGFDNIVPGDSLIFFKEVKVARKLSDLAQEK